MEDVVFPLFTQISYSFLFSSSLAAMDMELEYFFFGFHSRVAEGMRVSPAMRRLSTVMELLLLLLCFAMAVAFFHLHFTFVNQVCCSSTPFVFFDFFRFSFNNTLFWIARHSPDRVEGPESDHEQLHRSGDSGPRMVL